MHGFRDNSLLFLVTWLLMRHHISYFWKQKVSPTYPFSIDVESREKGNTTSHIIAPAKQNETDVRKSTRERRQPSYLDDYDVQVNSSTVTSCFSWGHYVMMNQNAISMLTEWPNRKFL